LINAPDPASIVFTAGGTEADNLAMEGVTRQYRWPQHLIISSVEHSAIAETANRLEREGWQVTRLVVNAQGRVNPPDLEAALQANTVLVSIIYGQSEVGTLQPIPELARIARAHQVLFHSDAVQVAGRLPLDVERLGVDLLSLSSHKLYGPQGVGALYVRPGMALWPQLMGGGQEGGLRSGTQALPAIAGFGVAAAWASQELAEERLRLMALRDRLFTQLADCPFLQPTGDRIYRLPHHVSFIVQIPGQMPGQISEQISEQISGSPQKQITGREIVRQLNLAGIGISAGSACHSGKLSPSPILLAMGYDAARSLAGIRLTLGKQTTGADIDWTALVLKQILGRLSAESVPLSVY
jgi:cysteine desulfurase